MTSKKTQTALETIDEILEALSSQVAIRPEQFGRLIGLNELQTAQAIVRGSLGVEPFQVIPRGRRMIRTTDVHAFLKEHGLELPVRN